MVTNNTDPGFMVRGGVEFGVNHVMWAWESYWLLLTSTGENWEAEDKEGENGLKHI